MLADITLSLMIYKNCDCEFCGKDRSVLVSVQHCALCSQNIIHDFRLMNSLAKNACSNQKNNNMNVKCFSNHLSYLIRYLIGFSFVNPMIDTNIAAALKNVKRNLFKNLVKIDVTQKTKLLCTLVTQFVKMRMIYFVRTFSSGNFPLVNFNNFLCFFIHF